MNALYKGVIVSGVVSAVAFYFITKQLMPDTERRSSCACSAARSSASASRPR